MNNFMYMNLQTGRVGEYDDWDYEYENLRKVLADLVEKEYRMK